MDKPASLPLSEERRRLLALRLKGSAATPVETRRIPRRPGGEHPPLSFAQHQLWVIDQMTPGNPAYNIPVAYRLIGELDALVLEESFNRITGRHEAWRTTFWELEGDAIQEIHPACKVQIGITDLGHLPVGEREAKARELASQEAIEPFDLRCLPLIRVSLFKLDQHDHVLLVVFHHIVGDGTSLNLMFDELDAFYRAGLSGTTPRLPELTVQYADFAAWQRMDLSKNQPLGQLDYWQRQLKGSLPVMEFATDKPRPLRQSFNGSNGNFALPKSLVQALTAIGRQENSTVFVTILAALQVILLRYSKAEEIVIGTPITNRPFHEVERLIGDFINIVALRCDISGNPPFIELLRRSKETALNALSNKDIPFEMVVRNLKSHRDSSRNPVFQVLLQLLPALDARIGELSIAPFDFELKSTQVDLALHLYDQPDGGILGRFQYCTDLFAAETVEGLSLNFVQLLGEIVKDPLQKILEIPIPVLPLSGNGQATRGSRPKPAAEARPMREYAPAQDSVQAQLVEIWEEVLQRKPIGIHDDFFDLGGHSLLVTRVIALTIERLGHRLPFAEFFANPTIAAHARSLSGGQITVPQTPYALIHPAGRQTPVFFFHGDVLGGGIFCKTLARMIGADRPFYVIPPHGTQGDEIPVTVEAMAAERLQWIRQIQPHGPYMIGGYCNGAILAYEAARQLREAGEAVAVVLMLMADGSNIRFRLLQRLSAVTGADEAAKRRKFLKIRNAILSSEALGRHYRGAAADWIKQPLRVQIARLWTKVRRVLRRFVPAAYRERLLGDPGRVPLPADAAPLHQEAIMNVYDEIFNAHVSRRNDSPVVLLWPKDEPRITLRGPADGWKKICAHLEVVEVPGDHTTCVAQDTNVVTIGEAMRNSIAQAERLLYQPSP
jgi:thioesterase domain-containing protein